MNITPNNPVVKMLVEVDFMNFNNAINLVEKVSKKIKKEFEANGNPEKVLMEELGLGEKYLWFLI
tara:strand:+ start:352 stop:546 length:195 start_codon:yes stop_codon:yes gene_type:complete